MSELFFTTTLMSTLKEAPRERTNLAQNCRASKQQNQDANPGSMGSQAIPTRRHQQKRTGKVELPLISCALGYKVTLSFNLVGLATPFQTIKYFIPKTGPLPL